MATATTTHSEVSAPMLATHRLISLKSLAALLDANRSSVRRWLAQAHILPVALGRGRRGAIRYRWSDVERWLGARQQVD